MLLGRQANEGYRMGLDAKSSSVLDERRARGVKVRSDSALSLYSMALKKASLI